MELSLIFWAFDEAVKNSFSFFMIKERKQEDLRGYYFHDDIMNKIQDFFQAVVVCMFDSRRADHKTKKNQKKKPRKLG